MVEVIVRETMAHLGGPQMRGVSRKQDWVSLELPPWQSLRDYVQKITIHEGPQPGIAPSEILPRLSIVIGFQYGDLLKVARNGDPQTLYESASPGRVRGSSRRSPRLGRTPNAARRVFVAFDI
jgi:hypothetical protein